jgi:N-acetylglucosamine repressor
MNVIRLHSPVPRADIADLTSLDRKSVTNLVNELLAEGLVLEAGKRSTGKGRPLTLLEFDRTGHWTLGIALSGNDVVGELVDLYGNCVAMERIAYPLGAARADVLGATREVARRLKTSAGDRLGGTALAVPGILDLNTGVMRHSVNLPSLDGVDLRSELQDTLGSNFAFEESSRAKALAEKWFGLAKCEPDFVCIDVGPGVGAGIVQGRRVFSHGLGYVGEIGHVIIERDGRLCRCGHRGCLEAYVSDEALLRELNGQAPSREEGLEGLDPGNESIQRVLARAGYRLGFALSYLVNIVCPPLIVINGGLMRFREQVLPGIQRGLQEGALPECLERTRVAASPLVHAAALGAAACALSRLFEIEGHLYV